MTEGVTFVVPVYNGERTLRPVLDAILSQEVDHAVEVLVVDDGSTDGSAAIARDVASRGAVRLIAGPERGAAAALNAGVAEARYAMVAQVDQDVICRTGWLAALRSMLAADPGLAAVQGEFDPDPDSAIWARVSDLDLDWRYSTGTTSFDHVCTGNTLYRADALRAVGLFDPRFGYGYDNDLSYRLVAGGWKLARCPTARAVHRSRPSFCGWLRQQYGVAYGRLDLVVRHPGRWSGDRVSGLGMIAHAAGTFLAVVLLLLVASTMALLDDSWVLPAAVSMAVLGLLALERFVIGLRVALRFRDAAGLAFAPVHLLRDLAWCAAIAAWTTRRVCRRPPLPAHSMARS